MCGICGVLNYGSQSETVDAGLLTKMSDSIAHRGPDDSGTFVAPNRKIGFGFRRLSIVDLSPAGHQPMQTADGSLTIMLNGEIYNHLVLRKEFEARGCQYRSRSDTETILYAYRYYGVEFVHKLLGMFAIALWDEPKQRLVLARDRIGIKPIYYTLTNGKFIFGSEIKAILQHPDVHREMDEEALSHYLTFLVPPAPHTLFKNIFKLEAGHRLVVDLDGNMRKEQYWDPVAIGDQPSIDFDGRPVPRSALLDDPALLTEEASIRTIRTLLKQSIKDRMMSDVPFGVFLSGGIDSSTNVALMAELMDRPVDTFSVGIRDLEKYNEMGYARQIAKQFKTNHREVIIDQKDAFEFLPKLIYHQDEPLADPVCIPLYFVSKLARDNGTIVVQVGEGSDEQFAGYQWMLRELKFYRTLWMLFNGLPRSARSLFYKGISPLLQRRHQYLIQDYIRKGAEGDELFWGGAINFTEAHKRKLLSTNRHGKMGGVGEVAREWHADILRRKPSADYLTRMIYLEFKSRLPELLLMRVDKMSMATSVEARVPFLDHRLVEYSMQIPARLKINGGEPKYILKKAVEGIVPNNIIYRKKQGFAAPMNEWLRNDWYRFAESKLMGSSFVREGWFNRDFVSALLTDHRTGRRDEGQNIWNLLNLTLWHEHWIEGKSIA
jgi:asparagine synthase (glutamine-hydrolysing)